jgi:arsenate reductase
MSDKKRVLFVCIHNSARSQMAEAFVNKFASEKFEAESAGLEPGKLNPFVVKAMAEIGIDISKNNTNSVKDFYAEGRKYDYVIAVCDKEAADKCPIFPGVNKVLHWPFEDPSSFTGDDTEKLEFTKKVRDQIKEKVLNWVKTLSK